MPNVEDADATGYCGRSKGHLSAERAEAICKTPPAKSGGTFQMASPRVADYLMLDPTIEQPGTAIVVRPLINERKQLPPNHQTTNPFVGFYPNLN
jgi:hypothetical protein